MRIVGIYNYEIWENLVCVRWGILLLPYIIVVHGLHGGCRNQIKLIGAVKTILFDDNVMNTMQHIYTASYFYGYDDKYNCL